MVGKMAGKTIDARTQCLKKYQSWDLSKYAISGTGLLRNWSLFSRLRLFEANQLSPNRQMRAELAENACFWIGLLRTSAQTWAAGIE